LARVVAGGSRVLLLDEPMAGLSPAMAERVIELIQLFAKWGCGILLIEHNFDHVEAVCDEGIFMVAGRITGRDRIAALLSNEQVIEHYLGV
jgi:ABC-type branched-subunit amino acid transport system ATPase component